MRATTTPRRVLLAAVTAVLVLLGGPLPATAESGTTITGRVDDGGRPVAGVPVGYSDPSTTLTVTARTAADGRFTIHVPADAGTGFVWAGRDLRELRVVFRTHGVDYLRAVAGRTGPAGALFQTRRAAAPGAIGGGREVAIHLRRAARVAGQDASLARFTIVLSRGDGSLVQAVRVDTHGGYRSTPLAPGRYRLSLRPPGSEGTTAAGTVTLRAGRATPIRSGAVHDVRDRETLIRGIVSAPAGVGSVAVRVEAHRGGRLVAAVRADAHGRYRIRGLAPGGYTLIAGRNTPDRVREPSLVHPTPDDTVAATATVRARSGRTASADLRLGRAGRVAGTTSAGPGLALVEDGTGALVRVARIGANGAFRAGGLPAGGYRVVVTTTAASSFGTADAHVVAGRTTAVGRIVPTSPLPSLPGTISVPGVTPGERINLDGPIVGTLPGYDTAAVTDGAGGDVSSDGTFTRTLLLPGLHRFVASSHLGTGEDATSRTYAAGTPLRVDVTADPSPIALHLGPRDAVYAGSFRSTGGPASGYLPVSLTSASGRRVITTGDTVGGAFEFVGPAGTYRWDGPFPGTAPASDGPWWAHPVAPTLSLPDGIERHAVVRLAYHH